METKYCKYCQCEHPLTDEWWIKKNGTLCICKKKRRFRYNQDKVQISNQRKHYYANNCKKLKEYSRSYRIKHPDCIEQQHKNYRANNKEKIRCYEQDRLHIDTNFKLRKMLRNRMVSAVKKNLKCGSSVKDLGCTIPELKQYLESKFQEGMTWENWGVHGWHIDHIVPLASFDLADREQFLKACHYTNLQPLWAKDNLSKGCKTL